MSKIKLYKFNFNLTDDKKDSILFAYNEESFQIVSKRFLFKLDTGWKRVSSKNRKRLGINSNWNAITEEFHIKSLLKAELIIDGVVIKGVYPHLDAASPKHPSYEGLQNGVL